MFSEVTDSLAAYSAQDSMYSQTTHSNILQTREMAGYINALYGLCAQTDGNPFSNLLHMAKTADPRTGIVLRAFMALVGNKDFSTALTKEYQAQLALPVQNRCALFMGSDGLGDKDGLYYLMNQSYTFTASGTTSFTGSVIQLCQKYTVDYPGSWSSWQADFEQMQNALTLGSPLYEAIQNIGQPPASGGWNAKSVARYSERSDANLETAMGYFSNFLSDIQTNVANAIQDLQNFKNAASAPSASGDPACSTIGDDPNYQAMNAFLNDEWFNINAQPSYTTGWPQYGAGIMNAQGALKDSAGNVIYAYTINEYLDAFSKVQPQDQQSYYNYFQVLMNAEMGKTGTPVSPEGSWLSEFQNNIFSYYKNW